MERAATRRLRSGDIGVIGEYVVIARRSGDEWFVGAMTDEARIHRLSDAVCSEVESALDSLGTLHQHHMDDLCRLLNDSEAVFSWHAQQQAQAQTAAESPLPATSAPHAVSAPASASGGSSP